MNEPLGVTILGSTGSIGVNTLDVLARHPDRFRVVALTANHNSEALLEQCRLYQPQFAVMADPVAARFIGGQQPRASTWRFMATMAGSWALNGFGMFSVIEKASSSWVPESCAECSAVVSPNGSSESPRRARWT